MCLAVPGKILEVVEVNGGLQGRVQFGGVTRQVSLDFLPEAQAGDYVMVHVGFAISRVDADEAERTYALLREMGYLEEESLEEESAAGGAEGA
jgi:hydrogenase expression/formation protein HypC